MLPTGMYFKSAGQCSSMLLVTGQDTDEAGNRIDPPAPFEFRYKQQNRWTKEWCKGKGVIVSTEVEQDECNVILKCRLFGDFVDYEVEAREDEEEESDDSEGEESDDSEGEEPKRRHVLREARGIERMQALTFPLLGLSKADALQALSKAMAYDLEDVFGGVEGLRRDNQQYMSDTFPFNHAEEEEVDEGDY
jgi:hypothetical protein